MLETYPDTHALTEAAAHGVEACLAKALNTRGRAALVGTGGRSPGEVYDRLRDADIDWARVNVTLSDERCVAPDAPEANVRLLRERLMQGPVARAHVVPLWPEPEVAVLRALLPFDAVLLGMGEDGHIASLIPGDPDLSLGLDPGGSALTRLVPAGLGKPPVPRITLTLSALLQSRAVFLLISGEAKREVIARAQGGADLPVRSILVQDRVPVRVLWAP